MGGKKAERDRQQGGEDSRQQADGDRLDQLASYKPGERRFFGGQTQPDQPGRRRPLLDLSDDVAEVVADPQRALDLAARELRACSIHQTLDRANLCVLARRLQRDHVGMNEIGGDLLGVLEARHQPVELHIGDAPRDHVKDDCRHQDAQHGARRSPEGQAPRIQHVPGPEQHQQEPQPGCGRAAYRHPADLEIVQRPIDDEAQEQRRDKNQDAAPAPFEIDLPHAGDDQREQGGESRFLGTSGGRRWWLHRCGAVAHTMETRSASCP